MKNEKICFVNPYKSPEYLGGLNLFHKNLIKYIQSKNKNIKISWIYFGKENRKYIRGGVEYIKLKCKGFQSQLLLKKNLILAKFFKKNYFDIINSVVGYWRLFYKKKKNQKIIQTFHGTVYYFNKNHFGRFNIIKKILLLPLLGISWIVGLPGKKTDKIICVSEKVKKQVEKLYGKRKKIIVIRTGVNLKDFKYENKNKSKEKINLDKKIIYSLYVGNGGYWTKGLDRAIKISKEIFNLNKNYRLIIIGSDYKKVKHLLNEKFIIYHEKINRKEMPKYYNSSDIFFCMSRYEGGAPTLVVSEAMASGCLVVCAKSAEQEIIEDGKNGLIIENFGKEEAEKILENLNNKKIIQNSMKTIKKLSLENWGEKYLKELLN